MKKTSGANRKLVITANTLFIVVMFLIMLYDEKPVEDVYLPWLAAFFSNTWIMLVVLFVFIAMFHMALEDSAKYCAIYSILGMIYVGILLMVNQKEQSMLTEKQTILAVAAAIIAIDQIFSSVTKDLEIKGK